MKLCECGCGQEVAKDGNRFILGHYGRGKTLSDDIKQSMSDSRKGMKIKSFSETHKKRISKARIGHKLSDKTKRKMSASRRRENHPNWQGGISFLPYCYKFDNEMKESIREQYGRVCFICGKTEIANGAKLSVHHTDYNKEQGCNGHDWKLIPLCKVCHGKCHGAANRNYWESFVVSKLATYI